MYILYLEVASNLYHISICYKELTPIGPCNIIIANLDLDALPGILYKYIEIIYNFNFKTIYM